MQVWVSKVLLAWASKVLQKKIAQNKLFCITSSKDVCRTLRERLGVEGLQVHIAGAILGVDYGAGGKLYRRPAQKNRRRKMTSRNQKPRWWIHLGGETKQVVRGGSWPEGLYGCASGGIPPTLLRDARRMHVGVARVKCSGASLTARFALGGNAFQDIDISVTSYD